MGAFEDLVAGSFFDSMVSPFSALIETEVFYLIIWVSMLGILFMRTKNWGLTTIALMVSSFAIVPLILPSFQKYLWIFVLGAVVYIFYDIFKTRR